MKRTGHGDQEATTGELIRDVIEVSRALLKTEVALARDELRGEIAALKSAALIFGVAAILATLALASFLSALLMSLPQHFHPAPVAGSVLLVGAIISGCFGYRYVPKELMAETRRRIKSDVQAIKERMT